MYECVCVCSGRGHLINSVHNTNSENYNNIHVCVHVGLYHTLIAWLRSGPFDLRAL